MNPETKAILDALLESRNILEARLDAIDSKVGGIDSRLTSLESKVTSLESKVAAMDARLETVAADVTTIKEQITDMRAKDQYLIQKTGELEAELFVVKRLQKVAVNP